MTNNQLPTTNSQKPITNLQVIGVRYSDSHLAPDDERSLDAYTNADVYATAGVPYDLTEPRFDENQRSPEETDNIGLLGGLIAQEVATARDAGKAILMTGANCSHMTGVVGGLQDAHGPTVRIGVVWFDAHGDFNTPNTTLSGMLGGMPLAVAAGLCYPNWRERSHVAAPLPTDRIIMVDVRNLDPAEEQLARAVGIPIAAPASGFPGEDLTTSVKQLADRCDLIYLHIDSDILDASLVPNHGTVEPDGPDMVQVQQAIDIVMATGKVAALAVVSVYGAGDGAEISQASGVELIRGGLTAWHKYGMA